MDVCETSGLAVSVDCLWFTESEGLVDRMDDDGVAESLVAVEVMDFGREKALNKLPERSVGEDRVLMIGTDEVELELAGPASVPWAEPRSVCIVRGLVMPLLLVVFGSLNSGASIDWGV